MAFQAVHYCPVPLCNGNDVGPLLYLGPLYTCLIHETFFEARSRWYNSLLRDSHEICRFFAGTYSQHTWHSVSMLAGVSSSPPLRDFSADLSHTIGANQSNGKMWQLSRFLRRNRSLEHHQQCLNLVSTNTRGLEIATTSHSQNSVKCCVYSRVIERRCGCLPHRYNIRGGIPL